ncbi:hypothetical protein HDK77DRAFT_490763 [Phyllosticta capitalensis]
MADDPPPPPPPPTSPPPPPPPEPESAGMAAESSRAAEQQQQPEAGTSAQRILDEMLPPEARDKLRNHIQDLPPLAAERKQPALFKAAVAWGELSLLKPSTVSSANAASDSQKLKAVHFTGNHATFVKHLYEWMEARWEWLEKDTRWKTSTQMKTEELLQELEKLKPGSQRFRDCWSRMLNAAQCPLVVKDFEMEGLELDFIAVWLLASAVSVPSKKKPTVKGATKSEGDATKSGGDAHKSAGDASNSGGDSSKSTSGPPPAANGAPGSSVEKPSADNKPSGSKKSHKKKKKKTGTASSNEPVTSNTNDSTASGAEPSAATKEAPGASGEAATSSNTTTPGNVDDSSPSSTNNGGIDNGDLEFIAKMESWLFSTMGMVQNYVQLPSTIAEALHFKLLPEVIVIDALLRALDEKIEDVDSALWDNMKKIVSITADFRVAQRDFADRLDQRFKAVHEKVEKAARKELKKQKKAESKKKRTVEKGNEEATDREKEDQREYEELVEQLEEAAIKAAKAGKAKVPTDGA